MPIPDPLRSDRDAAHGDLTERLDEQLLVERVRAGDPLAFEVLFRRYHSELRRIAEWVLGSDIGAEDVVQDVFLAVWALRDRWQPASVRPYLRRAARNMALRHSSRAARRQHEPLADAGLDQPVGRQLGMTIADPSPSLLEELDAAALETAVARVAETLPPRRREVYRLSRGEGLTTREIAERLHISPKTVELHLTRALAALRSAVAKWRGD